QKLLVRRFHTSRSLSSDIFLRQMALEGTEIEGCVSCAL
ncbi:hypothetical protein, partial [Escherichia coli]